MKLKLTVDGQLYEVDVEVAESEAPQPGYIPPTGVPRPGSSTPGTPPVARPASDVSVDETKVCRSPIAGVVVRVSAQVGQSIQAQDELMVLEAMKMETVITSPVAGKIAKVNAGVGDPVQNGQILVEFQ